jgi:hypothetical protein
MLIPEVTGERAFRALLTEHALLLGRELGPPLGVGLVDVGLDGRVIHGS